MLLLSTNSLLTHYLTKTLGIDYFNISRNVKVKGMNSWSSFLIGGVLNATLDLLALLGAIMSLCGYFVMIKLVSCYLESAILVLKACIGCAMISV